MRTRLALLAAVAAVGVASTSAQALEPLFNTGDFIIAIDSDAPGSNSGYPGAESPTHGVDQTLTTKYLNFGGAGTGLIVSPGSSIVNSLSFTTANDAPVRDPGSYQLFGTNSPIMSADNSLGNAEPWTLITSGTLALTDERDSGMTPINFSNATSYSSYKLVIPTLKGATNLMQFADVQLYNGGTGILSGQTALAIGREVPNSNFPAAEGPANLLDRSLTTKYLNFGRENSGVIVSPAAGATVAKGFRIATANDAPGRDPSAYEIYGTNAAITEQSNGRGMLDNWTLITSGTLALPDDRGFIAPDVEFANDTPYTSYKIVFTDNKGPDDAAGVNSIQIADFTLLGVPEPGAVGMLVLGAAGLLRRRRQQGL